MLAVVARVVLSILLAGIFYTGWMAVAIPTIKAGFGGLIVKVMLWILAPIITGFGFALGPKIFELLLLPDAKAPRIPIHGDMIGKAWPTNWLNPLANRNVIPACSIIVDSPTVAMIPRLAGSAANQVDDAADFQTFR